MATDLERLDELLSDQEVKFRRAFIAYAQLVRSASVMSMVEERLELRDVHGALRILQSYVSRMADVLPRIQQDVGEATAAELSGVLPEIALAISFDATDPRAAAMVRTQRLGLIREFSDSQFRSVQQAVQRALTQGAGAQALARAFRGAIGLTTQQEAYVESYRRLLEANSRDALDRALRDRRFDDKLVAALERDRPLTGRQIDTMVSRYRARALASRAETIARTEAGRASAEAREESLRQMVAQTGIDRDRIERIWNTTKDERLRDHHASMDRQVRGMDELFVDGLGNQLRYPHDPNAPAETVINCRCPLTFRVKPAA